MYECMYVLNSTTGGVHATKDTAATQLQQLELGRSAFQAKVDSVQQYNETVYSADMVLGLPTDCQSNAPARARPKVATTSSNSSSSRAALTTLCHECSSGSSSSNSSIESCENKKGAAAQRGSREKDLKDYAYSKALIDFKVLYLTVLKFSTTIMLTL